MKQFIRPLFYSDAHARKLLADSGGVRYANVKENMCDDQYFGGARSNRRLCEVEARANRRSRPTLYRVVVRLKSRDKYQPGDEVQTMHEEDV